MDGSVPLLSDEDIAARVASLSNQQHSDNGSFGHSDPFGGGWTTPLILSHVGKRDTEG